ncbi:uncharacterized protein LOC101856725 [Aplysia californica]|uniref:Uncharacterized protein LOC101856725 n=1 Tax=Aplysia californica TaxID=6500 RepID=A0ABM0JIP5_APLCA|nr:uncharacterized protein LOC101856725 [Aplysia californica]
MAAWAAVVLLLLSGISVQSELDSDIHGVLSAIDKLVSYFKVNVQNLNLDGLFGLRVVEGQLHLLVTEYSKGNHKHLSPNVLEQIVKLKTQAEEISAVAVEPVRNDDSKYFDDFNVVIASPWKIMKPHRKLVPSLRWEIPQYKAKVKVKLTEELSDRCMTELMQSTELTCNISAECAKIMTMRGLTGYGVTHQLLWSALGEKMPSCRTTIGKLLEERGVQNVSQMQLELCTNIFYEMVAVVQVLMHGEVHESHQDLFLEQQFVCPNLGFYEFLKKDYLGQILKWQFPSGCFGESEEDEEEDDDEDVEEGGLDLTALLEGYHEGGENLVPRVDDSVVKKMAIEQGKMNVHGYNKDNVLRTNVHTDKISHSENPVKSQSKVLQPYQKSQAQLANSQAAGNTAKRSNVEVTSPLPQLPFLSESLHKPLLSKDRKVDNRPQQVLAHKTEEESLHIVQKRGQLNEKSLRSGGDALAVARKEGSPVRQEETQTGNTVQVVRGKRLGAEGKLGTGGYGRKVRHGPGRRLLVEKDMGDGCLSHKTGVAAGALVMYLRYLIDPGDIKWTGQHELFLSDTRSLLQAQDQMPPVDNGEDDMANEEDEETDEDGEENVDLVNDNRMMYNADEEGEDGELDEEDEEGDEDGEDYNPGDYNDEKVRNDGGEDEGIQNGAGPVIRFGASLKSGTIVISEDSEKDSADYANAIGKPGAPNPNRQVQLPGAAIIDVEEKVADQDQEEDHNYDDEGEMEKGIIKRMRPPTPRPHPPIRARRKHSGQSHSQVSFYGADDDLSFSPDHPNYTVIVLVSVAPFCILFFFLFKFIRKRRVHIRYYF